LGATGFIGKGLYQSLEGSGHQLNAPVRSSTAWRDQHLGHVIYAIGRTADFRQYPYETIDAHVTTLQDLLQNGKFFSLLYLSSTRVYKGASKGEEGMALTVNSSVPEDLYNLSKLLGESLCLQDQRPSVRVVRLSNVYGLGQPSPSFLRSVIMAAQAKQRFTLDDHPDSAKDYIALSDLLDMLPVIAEQGKQRLYNLASGKQTSHRQVLALVKQRWPEFTYSLNETGLRQEFPLISVDRMTTEFGFHALPFEQAFPKLLQAMN
jgi:nucleoside-diphosphate-sugar epimerase